LMTWLVRYAAFAHSTIGLDRVLALLRLSSLLTNPRIIQLLASRFVFC
jgi:hypothetical protein